MKKLILIALVFFLCLSSAKVVPLSQTTDIEYLINGTKTFTQHETIKYYYDGNVLKPIDLNFREVGFANWDYGVARGEYKLLVKEDGTTGFRYKNKGFNLKLKGIGFYNTQTKETLIRTNINFPVPEVNGNKIQWSFPFDINYFVEVKNKHWRDVLEMPQSIKTYLLNNRPQGWTVNNTWFGLIYDANGVNLNFQNFDSFNRITFRDENNNVIFSLPPKKVYHALHQSGEGDFNNTDREWRKRKIFLNGNYIEAIPVKALLSEDGKLIWNADTTINITVGTDDAEESNFGTMNMTGNPINISGLDFGAGFMFRAIPIEQGETINDANIIATGSTTCAGFLNCSIDVFGVDADDVSTWSATNRISTAAQTTAKTDFDDSTNFSPNAKFKIFTINVQGQVQEIIDRGGWLEDNNMSFIFDKVTIGLGNSISITSFEGTNPEASLQINFGEEINPCQPTIDQDWIITEEIYCKDEIINTGTGETFITDLGLLGLTSSSLITSGFHAQAFFKPVPVFTFDANIFVSDSNSGKSNIAYTGFSTERHMTSGWTSANNQADHYAEIQFLNPRFIEFISWTQYYTFNFFTDVNVMVFDGVDWITVFEDSTYSVAECDANIVDGLGNAWCDQNVTVNLTIEKARFSVRGTSKIEGYLFNFNGMFGMSPTLFLTPNQTISRRFMLTPDSNRFVS